MFAIRLALHCGRVDVDAMLDSLTSRQLTELMAFHELDPWGEGRADLRMGIQAALTANINRDSKKKPEPFSPEDFMPFVKRRKENPAAKLRAQFAHRVKRKKGK
jgi:hypothetical protein